MSALMFRGLLHGRALSWWILDTLAGANSTRTRVEWHVESSRLSALPTGSRKSVRIFIKTKLLDHGFHITMRSLIDPPQVNHVIYMSIYSACTCHRSRRRFGVNRVRVYICLFVFLSHIRSVLDGGRPGVRNRAWAVYSSRYGWYIGV